MNKTISIVAGLCLASVALHAAASRALPQLRVNAVQEKKNAVLNIEKGGVSAIGGGQAMNGILATTMDFKGQPLRAYVIFADSVAQDTIDDLSAFQGKIAGSLQCQRIRMGTSPDAPDVKMAVLAEQCVIKSLHP